MRFIGMDVHKSFCHVAILDKETGVLDDFRIESNPDCLRRALCGFSEDSRVALEASSHWCWVVDELQDMGMEVLLSHPTKTKAIASAKIKTDKVDAIMLSRLLAADLLPQAHIPEPSVRELRSYLRHRCALVRIRSRAKNHIHSILAGYGLKSPYKDAFCNSGLRWLEAQEFRPLHKAQIDDYLELIDLLSSQIAEIEKYIRCVAKQNTDALLLVTIPGISYFSALLTLAEIDGVNRFPSAKQLVSYAGLCPSTRSSGGRERHGHITRCGSRFLRWVLVEAAQKAVYSTSPLNRSYWSIAKRKGSAIAKVAVARKLLECIYQMLKKKQSFDITAWNGHKAG